MKKGLHLEIREEQDDLIKKLMSVTGLRTKADLFNNALSLFVWALNEIRKGRKIVSVDDSEKHMKELMMPALSKDDFTTILPSEK